MNDHTQVSAQHKPKSLLQAHQEAESLVKALNEFAESQETPVSWDMMSDPSLHPQVALQRVRSPPKPTTVESPPEPPEDLIPEVTSNTIANANAKPKSNRGAPLTRRKPPVHSEQPSIPHLLELGVKVRDFGYENPLPPVPTVYLQPRQIQPSVPKDVNDPNDPHYVLEEERKKKVYSFASTRKIERTPTEPLIETDLLPPPRREFPKIKRTDAQLDLGSQPPSYSPPPPPPHSLLQDTINESSESQPLPGLTMDSQPADQWVDTPIATPHGSHQWAAMSPSVTDTSAVPASQQLDSDSQAPPMPELLSYSQMGFSHPASPQSQSPLRADSGHRAPLSSSHTRSRHQEGLGSSPGMGGHVSPMRRPLTPNSPLNPRCRNDGDRGRVESHSSPRHSPLAVVRSQVSSSSSPSRQPHGSLSPAPVPLMIPSSPIPRYNFRTKRRAESPAPTSHSEHPSTRPRLTRSVAARVALSSNTVKPPVSIKSAHAQGGGGGASKATTSTGRTLRKSNRAVTISAPVPERETRSTRRRK